MFQACTSEGTNVVECFDRERDNDHLYKLDGYSNEFAQQILHFRLGFQTGPQPAPQLAEASGSRQSYMHVLARAAFAPAAAARMVR